jgi:microcystin degradation protein MlrC
VRLVNHPRLAVGPIGDVQVILTDGPTSFSGPHQFEPCGLDSLSRKLGVVKESYLYPGLTRIASRYVMLLTPGAGDLRIKQLTYTRRRKPVFRSSRTLGSTRIPRRSFELDPKPAFSYPESYESQRRARFRVSRPSST